MLATIGSDPTCPQLFTDRKQNEELQDVIQQCEQVFQNTQVPESICVIFNMAFLIKKRVAPHLFFVLLFVVCSCVSKPEGEFPQKNDSILPVACSQNHAYFPHPSISHHRRGKNGRGRVMQIKEKGNGPLNIFLNHRCL